MVMNNLWAPWRMEFISDKRIKEGMAPCVFCELRQEKPSEKNLILFCGEEAYVVMNRFPYANGHLLIAAHCHSSEIGDLSPKARLEVMTLADESMKILKKVLECDGFNCGINFGRSAGAGVLDHFHLHVVPRWSGDTNFMPIMADIRCMPEYLEKTYEKLKGSFKNF